jgi:hypothetical protein
MDIRSALKSQYHAALKMLRDAIDQCPDAMWNDPADGPASFWRVAYHTLFYAHFYLQQDEKNFVPWERALPEAHFIEAQKPIEPYTKADLLEYWQICDGMIDAGVHALDLSASQCGFYWYKMSTLEHQLVNLRHIQHHAAALSSRLRRSGGIAIGWVGRG